MNKKAVLLFHTLFIFLVVGCVPVFSVASSKETSTVEETFHLSTDVPKGIYEQTFISPPKIISVDVDEALELTPTPILNLTPTEMVTVISKSTLIWDSQRANIRNIMLKYGFVEEYYLTNEYWGTLYNSIDKYGVAERIVALEYHGNNYNMYDGAYSLNPDAFYKQMEYLMKNHYHFVTVHELKGFLEGWLNLPKRSIILTTDSGYTSQKSFESIISQFSELELTYGYKPHMQSYVWTKGMTEEETSACKEDACWKSFRKAKDSGFFTFGTHSQTHSEFEFQTVEFLKDDLRISIVKIFENIELNVYAITWPHESCSWNLEALEEIGIEIGFGGLSKFISDAFVYKNDQMYNCLPRLFPPNGGGYSSRPYGFTLEDMLLAAEINK